MFRSNNQYSPRFSFSALPSTFEKDSHRMTFFFKLDILHAGVFNFQEGAIKMLQHTVIEHPIPPTWNNESEILILGSFPSVKSRETGYFYGHPQTDSGAFSPQFTRTSVPQLKRKKRHFFFAITLPSGMSSPAVK